jgi:hypothetical protein
MSRRALFPSDLCVLRKRRIDHLSDPSQSPRLHDTYRQKTPQGQREFFETFPFSETLYKCPRPIKSGKAQKIAPSGGGDMGNVQEKTFLSNYPGSVGRDLRSGGSRPQ